MEGKKTERVEGILYSYIFFYVLYIHIHLSDPPSTISSSGELSLTTQLLLR